MPGKTIGFEARAITLEFYEKFAETLAGSGCRLSKADGLVEQLRVIKDAEEIRRMEISCRLNQQDDGVAARRARARAKRSRRFMGY